MFTIIHRTGALTAAGSLGIAVALVVPAPADAAPGHDVFIPTGTVVAPDFDPAYGGTSGRTGAREAVADDAPLPGSRSGDCKWRTAGALPGSGWSGAATGCYLIGTTKNTTVTYFWKPTSDADSCVQGKGFNALTAPVWQSAGCLGGGSTTILWGNVAANEQVKVKSLAVVTGSKVQWQ